MIFKKNLIKVKFISVKTNVSISIIDLSPRPSYDSTTRIRVQLKYDNEKLFVMIRHANNLVKKKRRIFLIEFSLLNI
jgi:uncharacterized FlgJ-related protein